MIDKIKTNLISAIAAMNGLEKTLIEYFNSQTLDKSVMITGIKKTDISNFRRKKGREYSFRWMEKVADNIIRWEMQK